MLAWLRHCFVFANARGKFRVPRDGGHSSMVEPQIVVLAVAGSSPVGHPEKLLIAKSSGSHEEVVRQAHTI
jgi:hypothetical protein